MKVACVEYLNALPFTDALEILFKKNQLNYIKAVPANCANLLKTGAVDLALLPIGAISDFEKLYLISDYCIACVGPVRTVKLFSNQSIESIDSIVLDSASRTSNELLRILLKDYWKNSSIKLIKESDEFSNAQFAKLKIGDAAFELEGRYAFEYDLGEIWYALTGLPFVFAVWVATKQISKEQQNILNEAFKKSIASIDQLIYKKEEYNSQILESYFKHNIHYELDVNKKEGMKQFLNRAGISNCLMD